MIWRVQRNLEGNRPRYLHEQGPDRWMVSPQRATTYTTEEDATRTADGFNDYYATKGYPYRCQAIEQEKIQ